MRILHCVELDTELFARSTTRVIVEGQMATGMGRLDCQWEKPGAVFNPIRTESALNNLK
jgi:hypothetical protein